MANEFVLRNGFISLNNSTISGSLNVLNGITGSLFGTSSYAITASYVEGFNLSRIIAGNVTASVSTDINNLFLIKSGSIQYLNISSSSNIDVYSNLFIIRNFTTQQPVLTVSQSIVQFATQSSNPTGITSAGSIWFTSSSFYVGLEG